MTQLEEMRSNRYGDMGTTEAYDLLVAAGVFVDVAGELVSKHAPQRIAAVVDYCVNLKKFRHPPSAIVKALKDGWELDIPDKDLIGQILRGDR